MRMLARREHGERELTEKLVAKGFEGDIATAVVDQLKTDSLVSDRRFVEVMIDNRIRRGYGPLRIRHELRERGIEPDLIDEWIDVNDPMWLDHLRRVCSKKFGTDAPADYRSWARQARFLQNRGFSTEQIHKVVQMTS